MMEKKLKSLLLAVEKEVLRKPNRKTLDRLSLLAGFQDWDAFQRAFKGNVSDDLSDDEGSDTLLDNDAATAPR